MVSLWEEVGLGSSPAAVDCVAVGFGAWGRGGLGGRRAVGWSEVDEPSEQQREARDPSYP